MKNSNALYSTKIFRINNKKLRLSLIALIYFLFISSIQSQTIYNIQFSPASPSQLSINDHLYVQLDYIGLPDNVKYLVASPVLGGSSITAIRSTHTTDPSGSGHAELNFNTNLIETHIDCVAIIMFDNSHSKIGEFDIPVNFEFSNDAISNISVSPTSPAALQYDQTVTVSFDYSTDYSGDVCFFAFPLYMGDGITGGHAPSSIYPTGSGSASAKFNLETNGGTGSVADEIIIRMINSALNEHITEVPYPVQYQFGDNVISNIHAVVPSPAYIPLNQGLNVLYKYTTNEDAGVKVSIMPYSGGSPVSSSSTSSTKSHSKGYGSAQGNFEIAKGPTIVDQIRVTMRNSDETEILCDSYEPVNYVFSENTISYVTITPTSPAYIANSTTADVYFNYTEDIAENIKIEGQFYTGGSPTPGSSPISTSLLSGGSGHLKLNVNGAATVDQIRLRMLNTAGTHTYVDLYTPVDLHFLGQITTDVKNNSNAPFSFGLKQNYPNPFNPSTTISYSLAKNSNTIIKIYNLLGCEVATLVNEMQSAGEHSVEWNAQNYPSGVYYYRLTSGTYSETKKLVLLK